MTKLAQRTAELRSFNRFFTTRIGVLGEGILGSPYSLTEARVLFELAQQDNVEVAGLRRDLGLDAGYLSRILAGFERDGLVDRQRSTADARRQLLRLTRQGREAFAALDARSTEEIGSLLAGLDEDDQRRLIGAMRTVRELLSEGTRPDTIGLRGLRPGDLGWVVQRHGALYAEEYGWDQTFEALVARIVADFASQTDPAGQRAWIAEVGGEPLGSVFCTRKDAHTAQLRLLLVEPFARGLGIGWRLVTECADFARQAGYREMTLWTNDVLHAARRLYQRAGFRLVAEEKHHSFGHDLIGQNWSLILATARPGGDSPR